MTKGCEGVFRCKVGAAAMGNSLYVVIHNFSTLKRVVKGQCSCGPLRGSIHIKPEKGKCKCRAIFVILYENAFCGEKGYFHMNLELGMTGEATTTVVHENTAAAVGAGGVEVFGTPMMIALMENAAWRAVVAGLDEGDVTVGSVVNVKHLGATPLGQRVRSTAELVEIEGRRLVFRVEAYDEQKKIGEGFHERFVVNLERFLKRIAR